jgi:hypothetical protein
VHFAQIEGTVRGSDIAGKLPTKDAVIMWQLVSYPAVTGSTNTSADGYFTIDIQVWFYLNANIQYSTNNVLASFDSNLGLWAINKCL